MPTLQERIETATDKMESDADVLHAIVNGDASTVVETEGGSVSSVAKQVADLEAAYASAGAVEACAVERGAAETARDASIAAKVVSESAAATSVAARDDALAALSQLPIGEADTISADYAATAADQGAVIEAITSAQAVAFTLPPSENAVTGNVDEPFWLMAQRSGANDLTVAPVAPDTLAGGTDPITIANNAGARFTLDESVTPHNWVVSNYGAAVGDAEPIGVLKTFPVAIEPGYLEINDSYFAVAAYPDLAGKVYCGDANNATAAYWYRHTDPGNPSATRSVTGAYMKIPPRKVYQPDALVRHVLEVRSLSSGTFQDFSGIPSDAVFVDLDVVGASVSGSAGLAVQIGPVGGVDTSSTYVGASGRFNGGGAGYTSDTTSFTLDTTSANAADGLRGSIRLRNTNGNDWLATSNSASSPTSAQVNSAAGSKSLSGALSIVRLTTTNGTDPFDAGYVTVSYWSPATYGGVLGIKHASTIATPVDADVAAILAETQAQNALISQITSGKPDYVSPVAAFSAAALLTISHPLGVAPERVEYWAVCTSAIYGWALGQKFKIESYATGTGNYGFCPLEPTSTQVSALVGSTGIAGVRKDTYGVATFPPANFGVEARVWKGSTLNGGSGLTKWQSADIPAVRTSVTGAPVTVAHPLGKVPLIINGYGKCLVAEYGYSVGDLVQLPLSSAGGFTLGNKTAASVEVLFPDGYNSTKIWTLPSKTAGTNANLTTSTNWAFVLEVIA